MEKPKYVLYPGTVRSIFDGDKHYITASHLARLYNIKLRECIIIDPFSKSVSDKNRVKDPDLIHLCPLSSGKYVPFN